VRAAYIDKVHSIRYITDAPEPQIKAPDQVKIRVVVTGICGSEIHAFHGSHPFRIPPLISGHEMAGVVTETGENVTDIKAGDRVTVEPHYGCGRCFLCREGAYNLCEKKPVLGAQGWSGSFGEYIVVPQQTVIPIPEKLSFEEAALIEPLAVGMHAVRKSGLSVGNFAVIMGCGPIGLGVILCAKMAGASRVITSDVLDFNLDMAKKMGADHVIRADRDDLRGLVREITQGKGSDVSYLTFATTLLFDDALEITRRGGRGIKNCYNQ
jgi:L-iditol 2-dehydrogenase